MNGKKAKKLRRIATNFVLQTGKPIDDIKTTYKKLKSIKKK